MQGRFLIVVILALGALVGELHWLIKPQPTEKEIAELSSMWSGQSWVGRIAPQFELKTLRGDSFKLSENVGRRVIVLNFFATWCGPCQVEMPELVRYSDKHKSDPFVLIGVDADEKPGAVTDFLEKYGVHYAVAIDSGPVERAYGVVAYPTTVLIGADGRIQLYHTGALANADVALDAFLSSNRRIMESGKAITEDAYLKQVEGANLPSHGVAEAKTKALPLDDRGRRIAALMDCPCGCDKRVAACSCHTAAGIKRELAQLDFKNRTDADIIKQLNRKYCMAGM
jgi:thiol-disulfide isomerase/thioredoxin